LDGDVEHGDSLGNKGVIRSGDVQWMTAGSGIIHQEMPKGNAQGLMNGFQLWANLPAKDKMMNPRYRDVTAQQIPVVNLSNGTCIRVIAGEVSGARGPAQEIIIEPEYLDITVPAHSEFRHNTKGGHTVFAYVIDGQAQFCLEKDFFSDGTMILFEDGDEVRVTTKEHVVRFLLISGKPIGEPVAWYGPIVMNTEDELRIAFEEYEKGTFIKFKG
jgi:redox-sensitive bicupin YhaK (pirin superfamily)